MNRMPGILIVVMLLSAVSLFVSAQEKRPTLADLGWLSGCWDNGDTLRRYEEQWMKPRGTSMLGMSRTVAKGKTVEYEFLQIKQDTTGGIFYVANPSGQNQAAFKLVKFSADELVFENPVHDFPQRIIYRLNGNKLVARIEGINKGKYRGIDFPMMKIKCE